MSYPSNMDSVAQDQIRAFVERILRLKEEAKAINGDIREVYAEAKGNGFDKTVLGKLVSYVEKRSTDAAAVAEGEALFDLYLTAYDSASPSHVHARAHEAAETLTINGRDYSIDPPHDDDGVILEDYSSDLPKMVETIQPPGGAEAAQMQAVVADVSGSLIGDKDRAPSADRSEGIESGQPIFEPALAPSEIAEPGDGRAVIPSAAAVVARRANDYSKPNPWCQDPEDCGVNASWNHQCGSCQRRQATMEAAGAVQ